MTSKILPVLVVGSGPSGLIAALTLLKNGIPVRIIEKSHEHNTYQKGAGNMPRSLELYDLLGVLPEVQSEGMSPGRMRMHEIGGGSEVLKEFDMGPRLSPTPSIPYITPILIGQGHLEAILRSHLEKHSCNVELSTELRSFEQHPSHVSAHITKTEGDNEVSEIIQAAFLIGADGAKGIVRKQLGLLFNGETREAERFIVSDMEIFGLDREYWHVWGHASKKMLTIRPTEDKNNYYNVIVSGNVDYVKLVEDQREMVKAIHEISNLYDLKFGNVTWISEFRPNIRMVNKFGEGRVFVSGDAAHVHSPTGGQGLNSSVQDAFNLGWKIALVYKGLAPLSLLDTYTEERLPVIAEMLKTTTSLLNKTFTATTGDPSAFDRGLPLFQLGVNYRWSSIIFDEFVTPETEPQDPYGLTILKSGAVRAGDRAPQAPGLVVIYPKERSGHNTSLFQIFDPARHTILFFAADAKLVNSAVEALQRFPKHVVRSVVIVPEQHDAVEVADVDQVLLDQDGYAYSGYAIVKEGITVVVIRPDGVIGAMVKGPQGIAQYFSRIFSV